MLLYAPSPVLSLLDSRPNIGRLIELGEENYHLLLKLAPGLEGLEGCLVSHVAHGMDLHLEVLEQTPYTTLIQLTYYFGHPGDHHPDPNIQVRVYHDARQAEALRIQGREGGFVALGKTSTLHQKWRVSLFLAKWFSYCVQQGHRFQNGPAVQEASDAAATLI